MSNNIELIKALVSAQKEIKGATKDSINPHFKSKYADYESVWNAVREPLVKNGLCISHMFKDNSLVTRLMHVSGDFLESEYPIKVKDEFNPQAIKSAITYAKRANLEGLTGCPPTDDDDAEAAVHQTFDPKNESHKQALRDLVKDESLKMKIKDNISMFNHLLETYPPRTIGNYDLLRWLNNFLNKCSGAQK